ncbi:DNA cytosine methyltransferase [Rhizobium leguminosarum bv. viciae 248]|nr:DNA cytosine methyltransferase [Rhizobium leguminosarum bv. viciae 248]
MNVALRSKHLNILSICTGGGGLDLGVELAVPSARTVCMVEREAFAVAQLVSAMEAGLMAPAPIWSDARTFDGRAWRGAVDGLIGGIPCQPHSLAGRKQGSNDARDLWSTARRIIVQSRAWFVVIENVGGMLSAGSDEIAGAQRVFRDLSKLGFEVEGGLFTAAEVGASHQRERVIILGVADSISKGLEGRSRREVRQQQPAFERGGEDLVDRRSALDLYEEFQRNGFMEYAQGDRWGEGRPEPSVRSGRAASPVTDGAMGDTARVVGEDIIDRLGTARQRVVALDRSASRDGHGGGATRDLPGQREDAAPSWIRPLFAPGPADISSWCDTLASSPELEPAFRRVAHGLASRMDVGRVDRLRMLGNGVVPLQAAYALRTLVTRLAARGSAGATRLVRMMEID